MIGQLFRDLRQPEYVHALLNPLPIYGLAIALLGLVLALIFRSRAGQITALVLILVSAGMAGPVSYFGEQAYDHVLTLADEDGRAWLNEHEERAEDLMFLFYTLTGVTAAALLVPLKWPRTALPLALATVMLALVSLGAGASIAYAGGKIRHKEFRTVPPPAKAANSH